MGQQSVTVTSIGKGRPQLQVLKLLLFAGNRPANKKILHIALSYTGKNKLGLSMGQGKQWLPSRMGAGQKSGYESH